MFYFFRQVLMLETIRLGADCLFKHEPEGIVLVNRDPEPFALMYECKARSAGYVMSSDDLLRYKDYIKHKRHQIKEKYHLNLSHFVIVSSCHRGDTAARIARIERDGVVPCFVCAEYMRLAYVMARVVEFPELQLLRLRDLFPRGAPRVVDLAKHFPAHV